MVFCVHHNFLWEEKSVKWKEANTFIRIWWWNHHNCCHFKIVQWAQTLRRKADEDHMNITSNGFCSLTLIDLPKSPLLIIWFFQSLLRTPVIVCCPHHNLVTLNSWVLKFMCSLNAPFSTNLMSPPKSTNSCQSRMLACQPTTLVSVATDIENKMVCRKKQTLVVSSKESSMAAWWHIHAGASHAFWSSICITSKFDQPWKSSDVATCFPPVFSHLKLFRIIITNAQNCMRWQPTRMIIDARSAQTAHLNVQQFKFLAEIC